MTSKFERQMAKIAKLPHDKNDFVNPNFQIYEYPEVELSIVEQAAEAGFCLPEIKMRGLTFQPREFELQTHYRSVEEHTDDVERGSYFGLLPVRSKKVIVNDLYSTATWLHFQLGRRHLKRRMRVGELIVFNPRAVHSLVYYGEATTFMLFALMRNRRVNHDAT